MTAMRGVIRIVSAALLTVSIVKPASGGLETFDRTGLTNVWVSTGVFTGQEEIVWTYANARGFPTVFPTNPSITLRTESTATKGWLQSALLTGGVQQVSAIFKQEGALAVDCDIWISNVRIGNFKSSGASGEIVTATFPAEDVQNRLPFTNEFVLMVSNRLASAGRVGLDDLSWTPFRVYVRLDRTGTNTAYVGRDWDVQAQIFHAGQIVTGLWSITPEFTGTGLENPEWPQLTLIPAKEDADKIFTLTYTAYDALGETSHAARCALTVKDDPWRFVDFETAKFNYETNTGITTNLNGMYWNFFNVCTSDATDRKIGTTSARFRHSSSAQPAFMESLYPPFNGIGTFSLHYAYYGHSNRVVTFALLMRGEGEDWMPVPGGTFNVQNADNITNHVFSVDIQRSDDVWLKLITTGNYGEIANIDNIHIRRYGDVLPRLEATGSRLAAVGRETRLEFRLLNADFIPRDWEYEISPSNDWAEFSLTADHQLQLRLTPTNTAAWGEYLVDVRALINGVMVGTTTLTVRVASPPAFVLAPLATNLTVPAIVDVWVTNLVLHAGGTNWTTEWRIQPLFSQPHSVSNRSRFRIAAGTTEADVGGHTVAAVVTDVGTGLMTTNSVVIWVNSGGGGSTEIYPILSFTLTNLVVSGRAGRVYRPFAITNLSGGPHPAHWYWQGTAITNPTGNPVSFDLPADLENDRIFFGIQIQPAP